LALGPSDATVGTSSTTYFFPQQSSTTTASVVAVAAVAAVSVAATGNENLSVASSAGKKRKDPLITAAAGESPPKQKRQKAATTTLTTTTTAKNASKPAAKKAKKKKPKATPVPVPWETRFAELVEYQKGYGHCRPSRGKNRELSNWVLSMRKAYKDLQQRKANGITISSFFLLTDERIAKLEGIGFQWVVRDTQNTLTWEESFELLKEFKQEFGHTQVKRFFKRNGSSLGEWVHSQRQDYLKKTKQMTQGGRAARLDEIGFAVRTDSKNIPKKWDDRFVELVQYRREIGHCHIPKPSTSDNEGSNAGEKDKSDNEEIASATSTPSWKSLTPSWKSLAIWAEKTRRDYWLYWLQGKSCPLNKTRVKKLEEMGFNWGPEKKNINHKGPGPRTDWHVRFEELKLYRYTYGDCLVPQEFSHNKQLGAWVGTQRREYARWKAGKRSMMEERRELLESIGFAWIARPWGLAQNRKSKREVDNGIDDDGYV
jgi:hypothetical protein